MTDIQSSKDTILIVDDDPAIRLLMSHALSGSDLVIIEAESGEQAIEKYTEFLPELTLLDVTMPGMDGFECCAKLRKLSNGNHAAIVMVTGLDQPQDIEKAFDVGATDFMTKPLKWPIFSHRVRYILKANQTLRELSINKDMLANAQGIAHLGYWQWDFKTPVFQCSDELYRLMGLEPQQQEITYAGTLRRVHPEDRTTFMNAMRSALHDKKSYDVEYRIVRKNGDVINIHDRTDVAQSYGQWMLTGTLHDITNRKRSEQKISYYAYYDTLTELPNRRLFLEQLESSIAAAKRRNGKLSLMFIDLDRFKQVNDTYGHHIGDELLRQAATRIKNCVRLSDVVAAGKKEADTTVARLAGDEFTVLLCEVTAVADVAIIAQRIIEAFSQPFQLEEHQTYISVSIGITGYPSDANDVKLLLQHADAAMYHAKEQGRNNYQFFSESMNNALASRLEVEADLREALVEGNQFQLYYQPQIDAATTEICGFEALLRWQHPTKGLLAAASFIDVAESSSLILELGQWVLVEACRQAAIWHTSQKKNFRISVNVSAMQFSHAYLPQQVELALKESGLKPDLLELEITETSIIKDIAETIPLLTELKKMGVKLAIDDFGTGYSSLNYLKQFPIDTLKIDKTFVDEIEGSEKDAAIAQTIVQLARNLGLVTIAEGVENIQQQKLLIDMGCNELQGYFYSKPKDPESIEQAFFRNK